jgi:hypothetical protein
MVRKKINYAVVVFLLLSIAGCTKISKQDTTIEFVIRNPANGKPFVGVPVKIEEEHDGNKGITGETIFRGVTDVNGRISYTFKAKLGSGYWYYPYIDESYFSGTYGVDWSYLARPEVSSYVMKKDQYNEALYEVIYYAYLKEITKNTNCEGATDTLIYHAWTPQFPGGPGAYNYTKKGLGCYNFESMSIVDNNPPGYARVYMGWQKIEWVCRRPSGITHGVDSIWLDQGQTGTMELLY